MCTFWKSLVFWTSMLHFSCFMAQELDPDCDHFQEVQVGIEYYIYNPGYPANYSSAKICRWYAQSATGTKIVLSCPEVNLPTSTNCDTDALLISQTGDASLSNPRIYCGNTQLTVVSVANFLTVGFYSNYQQGGGSFACVLTAMESGSVSNPTKPLFCDCGWKQETRIVGGHPTGINEYPAMAALIDNSTLEAYCGATIISDSYAVTAAHCLNNRQLGQIGLLVGDYNFSSATDTDAAALYLVSEFLVHPQYISDTQENDIALVKTKRRMEFGASVGPICLPFLYTMNDFYNSVVTALGWGYLDFFGPPSDTLQEVDLGIISNKQCSNDLPANKITGSQICTFAPDKDTCLSDSGGPLLYHDSRTNRLQLVGIISYGLACATEKPAVNTRVTYYLDWILSVTEDTFYCVV